MDSADEAWSGGLEAVKLVLANSVVYGYATKSAGARGGAERFQWLLARALTKAGWTVVVGVRGHLAPGQESVIDGVRFVGMRSGNFIRSWSKFLSEQKPDWWFWRAADPLWAVLLIVARIQGVRGVFSAAFDTDVMPRRALIRHRRSWPLYALGLQAVDRIFVQHRGQHSSLTPRLRAKAAILPGLVDIPAKVKSREERGNYMVWVAVLRPHKRPDLLIEMARATPDLQFVVCGGTTSFGTSVEFTERILKDLRSLPNVRYLGDVEHERTLTIISEAMALISTSDQEGFPNIFLEAWSSGTPVVSLSIDPDDVIRNKKLGYVSGNVQQAVVDIRSLLASPEAFDILSQRVRNHAKDVHSETTVVQAFNKGISDRRQAE